LQEGGEQSVKLQVAKEKKEYQAPFEGHSLTFIERKEARKPIEGKGFAKLPPR